MPPLAHDFRSGVPGLLSAEGFDIAWTQYMTLMMEKLNALTSGMLEKKTLLAAAAAGRTSLLRNAYSAPSTTLEGES